ncbi:MAG TPA: ribulose-phosphate 3-epimerase, partial [Acidimicrobiales bacterium]|nr:ribulose-phosphate 3-epimerase [Acidimicrobiales bacterium]
MPHPPRIAPSILSADFAALADAIDRVAPETDILHVDVMDGHFVPNLTIGPPVVAAINRHTDLELDCHLMMTNPGEYFEAFQRAGADGCTVHVEIGGTAELIARMRDLGLRVGVAANPDTPFAAYEPFLDDVDLVLVGPDGWKADTIRALAEQLGVRGRVEFAGHVSNDRLAELYANA